MSQDKVIYSDKEPIDFGIVHCNNTYLPLFASQEGSILIADPVVREINLILSTDLLASFQRKYYQDLIHKEISSDLLYTQDEMQAYLNLIHFSQTKSTLVDSLVQRYCTNGDCGEYQGHAQDGKFNLEHLKDTISPWHYINLIYTKIAAMHR